MNRNDINFDSNKFVIQFDFDEYNYFSTILRFIIWVVLSSYIMYNVFLNNVSLLQTVGIIICLFYLLFLSLESYLNWFFKKKIIIEKREENLYVNELLFCKLKELNAIIVEHKRGKYNHGWLIFIITESGKKRNLQKYMQKEDIYEFANKLSSFLNLKILDAN